MICHYHFICSSLFTRTYFRCNSGFRQSFKKLRPSLLILRILIFICFPSCFPLSPVTTPDSFPDSMRVIVLICYLFFFLQLPIRPKEPTQSVPPLTTMVLGFPPGFFFEVGDPPEGTPALLGPAEDLKILTMAYIFVRSFIFLWVPLFSRSSLRGGTPSNPLAWSRPDLKRSQIPPNRFLFCLRVTIPRETIVVSLRMLLHFWFC